MLPQNFINDLIFRHYGISCDAIKHLNGYVALNYRVQYGDQSLVLKILTEQETKELECVEFQTELMVYLENKEGIRTNSLIRTQSGKLFAIEKMNLVMDECCKNQAVLLFTYVEGSLLDDAADLRSEDIFYRVGEFAGRVSGAMQAMTSCRRIPRYPTVWNLANSFKVRQHLHILPEKQRQKLENLLSLCEQALKVSTPLTEGIVHGDMNARNIILSPKDGLPDGIIDFCEAGFSYIIYDLAICLAHVPLDLNADFLSVSGGIVRGFLSHVRLPKNEVKLLKYFIILRAITNIVMNEIYATSNPGYLDIYLGDKMQEKFWTLLTVLEEKSPEELMEIWGLAEYGDEVDLVFDIHGTG